MKFKKTKKTSSVNIYVSDNVYENGNYVSKQDTYHFIYVVKIERRVHDYVVIEEDGTITIIPSRRVVWISEKKDS